MAIHPEAGKLPDPSTLENIPALLCAYYTSQPDPSVAGERVSFGTSGHRGSSLKSTFNEAHILAVSQAVCEYRAAQKITGPLFLGCDTHALSEAAFRSALEVLVANGVHVAVSKDGAYTATPCVSHAILSWNASHEDKADGIVVTPSHNPPSDGGFKYNPPHGGPADTDVTGKIETRANELLAAGLNGVKRLPYPEARRHSLVEEFDYIENYVGGLASIIDMEAIARSGLRIGVDPLGGASLVLWEPIAKRYGINLTVVNTCVDPTFRFVSRDKDGKIRMDCSSPWAMSSLLKMKDQFDLSFSCDPDSDRHGIVTRDGLMQPNHFLSVCAWYLLRTRGDKWPTGCGIGKTAVTSDMLTRIAKAAGRKMIEVPVGFKWFVPYLLQGECGFCCEESAGASFLSFDGSAWSTDKDGPLLCLLAAEIMAKEKASPSEIYARLEKEFGAPVYQRIDTPADEATRSKIKKLSPESVAMKTIGGSPIIAILSNAPGNGAAIGGVKVVSEDGWFAMRPSGTEPICKLYAESFKDKAHLEAIQKDAVAFSEQITGKA